MSAAKKNPPARGDRLTRRRQDWPSRLADYIAARLPARFVWGPNDCCSFAAGAVLAMTGIDPSRAWRAYKGPRGAAARLAAAGGVPGVIEAAARRHDWREIPPAYARRGDCVMIEIDGRESLGIVALDGRTALGPGVAGLIARPVSSARRAWAIG